MITYESQNINHINSVFNQLWFGYRRDTNRAIEFARRSYEEMNDEEREEMSKHQRP